MTDNVPKIRLWISFYAEARTYLCLDPPLPRALHKAGWALCKEQPQRIP